jgi:hypothetical protein
MSTMSRPDLADKYRHVASEAEWTPTLEYELLEYFWTWSFNKIDSISERIAAERALLQLVGNVVDGRTKYPWTKSILAELKGRSLELLRQHGWLRECSNGTFKVTTDRLFQWTAAKWLAEKLRESEEHQEDHVGWLREVIVGRHGSAVSNFAYVPMDLMWLVSNPKSRADRRIEILRAIIDSHQHDQWVEPLSTLGLRAVEPLVRYVERYVSEDDFFSTYADCLVQIARVSADSADEVRRYAGKLLGDPDDVQMLRGTLFDGIAGRLCEGNRAGSQTRESRTGSRGAGPALMIWPLLGRRVVASVQPRRVAPGAPVGRIDPSQVALEAVEHRTEQVDGQPGLSGVELVDDGHKFSASHR